MSTVQRGVHSRNISNNETDKNMLHTGNETRSEENTSVVSPVKHYTLTINEDPTPIQNTISQTPVIKNKEKNKLFVKAERSSSWNEVFTTCATVSSDNKQKVYKKSFTVSRPRSNTKRKEEKSKECAVCGEIFPRRYSLLRHMLIHTGEKKYQCSVCARSFTHSTTLKRHVLIHTGERNHQCTVCAKAFSRTCHLKKHMEVHTR